MCVCVCVCVCVCARVRLRELTNINFHEWQSLNSSRVYGFPGLVDAMSCFCSMSSALALTSSRTIKKEQLLSQNLPVASCLPGVGG